MEEIHNYGTRHKKAKRPLFSKESGASHEEKTIQTRVNSDWMEQEGSVITQIKSHRVTPNSNKVFIRSGDSGPNFEAVASTPLKPQDCIPRKSISDIQQLFPECDYTQGICPEDLNHTFNTTFQLPGQSSEFEIPSFILQDENLEEKSPIASNKAENVLPDKFWHVLKEERGITQLYDWQRDCLSLATTHKDKNLIYSLPTSGGKTLVAEIIMLETLLIRGLDAVLVLPYVSLVQEKVRGLTTIASDLGFNLEEYAGSKGALPPRKRQRRCLYVCTIEKANSLVTSLQDEKRLWEIGLAVVDELHMIGEEGGRGACLEACLAKIMYCQPSVRIVGMSATLANLQTIANFLNAQLYISDFRPVTLHEYFKLGQNIFRVSVKNDKPTLQLERVLPRVVTSCSQKNVQADPDNIAALVAEVVPNKSCLLFCASKVNCQNVASLLTTQLPRNNRSHKKEEKTKMLETLSINASGMCPILRKTIPYGIAYHHSGLTSEERKVIEEGFLTGTLCVLTCTSTLAAGVNLPASRVIIRSPYTGTIFLTRTRYVQMVGRAGRAGFGEEGESYVIGESKDRREIMKLMSAPIESCASTLLSDDCTYLRQLVLSAIGLGIANTDQQIQLLMSKTLLSSCMETRELIGNITQSVKELHVKKLIWAAYVPSESATPTTEELEPSEVPRDTSTDREVVYRVTSLGKAAYKSNIDIDRAEEQLRELEITQSNLMLRNEIHLLYLITPPDLVYSIKPDWKNTFNIVTKEGEEELIRVAQHLKVNPGFLSRLMTGTSFNSPEQETGYRRFYLSLLLYRIVLGGGEEAIWKVADEFQCSRGFIQSLLSSTAARCACLVKFSEQIEHLWPLYHLLPNLVQRVAYAAKPELVALMQLSGVGQGRARQLLEAGFVCVKEIARADPTQLVQRLQQVNKRQARQIIASAKLILQEKAEALREEAEELTSL